MHGYFRTSFSRQVAGTTPDLKSGAAKWGDGMGRMFVAAAAAAMVLAAGAGLTGTVAARRSQSGGPVVKVSSEPGAALSKPAPADAPDASVKAALTIDVPVNGAIYPPDIIPPQFAWRDSNPAATVWRIQVVFGEHARALSAWSNGEKMQVGELDTSLTGYVPPELTPEQAASHTWRPDPKTWEEIKKHSVEQPATVIVSGYASQKDRQPLSSSQARVSTSRDPVSAPLFYRDVPLLPRSLEEGQHGVIKPLPDSALPSIKWRLRYISQPQSKTVMEGLATCANCHSISRDGKTMGIDVDGPQNDKGLYAIFPIKKVSTISSDYVLKWSSYADERTEKRFGFMSQVSPEGKYVITSIDPPHEHKGRVMDRIYNGQFYDSYAFGQVFYPTRGVLAWYSRETRKMTPLPGADDPNLVQAGAFWSPDGKYIVFSRAVAKDPYPPGQPRSTYANDPNETQIQYDLYRIPFNDGKGGTPEKIAGASENGMSNNFPKVSPDGKWIVFVQCKNGLLMRPDSKLYIVPFEGGEARPLESNLPVMNSWHSWSPNGHWLAFSSKSPSFYTRVYLTHIDEEGHASAPIVVENATAANRAVNIPEFMNIGPDGLNHIETPAMDFYKAYNAAAQLAEKHQYAEAIPVWKHALEMTPDDDRAHNDLGVALAATGKTGEAIDEYNKSLALNADSSQTHNNLGGALAEAGKTEEAFAEFRKAIELNPENGSAHVNLGHMLEEMGGHRPEAIAELTKGIELAPKSSDGHNIYGVILARMGKLDEAIAELQKAVELSPQTAECRYNLGRALAASNRFTDALPQFLEAASLTRRQEPAILQMLAAMYSELGQYPQAVATAEEALTLAIQQHNDDLATALKGNLARYQHQAGMNPGAGNGARP
jgi:tetratricopeptide (TPR) repeat protein